jgi:hypothetical protein
MGDWVPAVAIVALALVIGATVVLRGPMGKALAEWIRTWSHTDQQWLAAYAPKGGTPSPELSADVEELKRRLSELEERLDFAERMLAKERDRERLAPPR